MTEKQNELYSVYVYLNFLLKINIFSVSVSHVLRARKILCDIKTAASEFFHALEHFNSPIEQKSLTK